MNENLSGKKFLVVGAGGLLGTTIVDELLKYSCEVIAADVSIEQLQERYSGNGAITIHKLDVTKENDVDDFFCSLENIDGAVNSSYPRNNSYGEHFFDVTLENFNDNVALNLGSSFCFSKYCAKYFLKFRKDFSLVNIASIYGVIPPKFEIYEGTSMTTPVEYAAIKSGLIQLSKYVAAYVSDSRFRVNNVSPGGIFAGQDEEFLKNYLKNTRGKGMLDPSDVVGSVLFLLSDQAKFVVGQNLIVDDGFTL
jgi:NAD(P)-dependent dehydrogenase (short-subunit alcohol dehydrogenase family)